MHRSIPTILFAAVFLLLAASALPVRATSPMIQGWAWVDTNCDGIRQDDESPATSMFTLYLYRFGADGVAFTSDDKQLRSVNLYISGPKLGQYEDDTNSAIMPAERYRLSILQGQRPAGYLPTLYRQGNDPARWSSLQNNWTTGDPSDGGFALDPNATVTGGNIGLAPASCALATWPQHVRLPVIQR